MNYYVHLQSAATVAQEIERVHPLVRSPAPPVHVSQGKTLHSELPLMAVPVVYSMNDVS